MRAMQVPHDAEPGRDNVEYGSSAPQTGVSASRLLRPGCRVRQAPSIDVLSPAHGAYCHVSGKSPDEALELGMPALQVTMWS